MWGSSAEVILSCVSRCVDMQRVWMAEGWTGQETVQCSSGAAEIRLAVSLKGADGLCLIPIQPPALPFLEYWCHSQVV